MAIWPHFFGVGTWGPEVLVGNGIFYPRSFSFFFVKWPSHKRWWSHSRVEIISIFAAHTTTMILLLFFTLNIIICDIVVFRPLRRRSEQSRAVVAKENNTKNRISWRSLEKRRRTKDPSKQQKQQSSKSLLMSPVSTTFQSPKDCSISEDTAWGIHEKMGPKLKLWTRSIWEGKITVTSHGMSLWKRRKDARFR